MRSKRAIESLAPEVAPPLWRLGERGLAVIWQMHVQVQPDKHQAAAPTCRLTPRTEGCFIGRHTREFDGIIYVTVRHVAQCTGGSGMMKGCDSTLLLHSMGDVQWVMFKVDCIQCLPVPVLSHDAYAYQASVYSIA